MPLVSRISDEESLQYMRLQAESDDRRRNKKHIREFVSIPVLSLVPLPVELENEPYAFYDTRLRPDVIGPTGFMFSISDEGVSVRAGEVRDDEPHYLGVSGDLPSKSSTQVSVPLVYKLYGLDITYSYLRFLYERKYNASHPEWLALYLKSSLSILQPGVINERLETSPEGILLLCMRILIILVDRNSKEVRMRGELEQLPKGETLPSEIIARITGSRRLSTVIAATVWSQRCGAVPIKEELHVASDQTESPLTLYEEGGRNPARFILNYSEDGESRRWQMLLHEGVFVLENGPEEVDDEYDQSEYAQFSLIDYAWVFKSRECDVNRAMTVMLRDLQLRFSVVVESDISEVCAWIVQLSSDTNSGIPREFITPADLRDELQRLLSVAIGLYL